MQLATPGKHAATFEAFAADLAAHGGAAQAITDVSLDRGAAYQAGAPGGLAAPPRSRKNRSPVNHSFRERAGKLRS